MELDSWMKRTISLLNSSNPAAGAELRGMLDNVLRRSDNTRQPLNSSGSSSNMQSNKSSSLSDTSTSIIEPVSIVKKTKLDVSGKGPRLFDIFGDLTTSSTAASAAAAAAPSVSSSNKVVRGRIGLNDESDEEDNSTASNSTSEQGSASNSCHLCLKTHSANGNNLVECAGDCLRSYHQLCHTPNISIRDADWRSGWLCAKCVKRRRRRKEAKRAVLAAATGDTLLKKLKKKTK